MFGPFLATGVEQSDAFAGFGIEALRLSALESVTHPTGKPEVLLFATATFRSGPDVVELQPPIDQVLWSQAIAAAITRLSTYTGLDFLTDSSLIQGLKGSRNPLRTDSRSP